VEHKGRARGTPNKSTAKVKAFLDRVFDRVFATPGFEDTLVEDITARRIDNKLLTTLLAYYAGRPAQAVDVSHRGTVTLEQIIAGRIPADEDQEDESDGESAEPEAEP